MTKMTKEKLKQYNDLKRESEKLQNRIEKLKKQSEMVSDVVQNGYKRHAIIYGYDIQRAQKLNLLIEKFERMREKALNEQLEIVEFISDIPKSELRLIFELRFEKGLQLFEVAHKMNEIYKTERYSDDSVRKKIDRYMQKF